VGERVIRTKCETKMGKDGVSSRLNASNGMDALGDENGVSSALDNNKRETKTEYYRKLLTELGELTQA